MNYNNIQNMVRLVYNKIRKPIHIKVCNAINTSDYDKIEGKDCIDYWDEHAIHRTCDRDICRKSKEKASEDDSIVGAHVIGYTSQGLRVFIVPILKSFNDKKGNLEPFEVEENDLVRIPNEEDERKILLDKENQEQIKEVFGSDTLLNFLRSCVNNN